MKQSSTVCHDELYNQEDSYLAICPYYVEKVIMGCWRFFIR